MWSLRYYGLVVVYYFAVLWYDQNYVDLSAVSKFGKNDYQFFNGRLKYLTQWNMLLQAFFFTVAFLNEIIGNTELSPPPKRTPTIRKLKDLLLPSLAFPISMFVGLTFWALYLVDRELVFPKVLDAYFPQWLNHVMHTNIMIFMFLEMYISFRRYPPKSVGLSVLAVFMLCYLAWIHVIFVKTGIWVYPVLEVVNLPGRIVFFAALLGVSVVLYLLGEKVNQKIWLSQVKFVDSKTK